jgi:hypothetical protein
MYSWGIGMLVILAGGGGDIAQLDRAKRPARMSSQCKGFITYNIPKPVGNLQQGLAWLTAQSRRYYIKNMAILIGVLRYGTRTKNKTFLQQTHLLNTF